MQRLLAATRGDGPSKTQAIAPSKLAFHFMSFALRQFHVPPDASIADDRLHHTRLLCWSEKEALHLV